MNGFESDHSDVEEETIIPCKSKLKKRTAVAMSVGSGPVAVSHSNDKLEDDQYACSHEGCKKIFSSEASLLKHKEEETNHEYCGKCDRDFKNWDAMQAHLIMSGRHIICVECMKEFQSEGGLTGHTQQMHRGQTPVSCPGCRKKFPHPSGLTQHIENDICTGGVRRHMFANKIIDVNNYTPSLPTQAKLAKSKVNTTSMHVWREGVMVDLETALADADDDLNSDSGSELADGVTKAFKKLTVLDYTDSIQPGEDENKATPEIVEKCWRSNLGAYVCCVKNCSQRFGFQSSGMDPLHALIQHLNSAVHAARRFRCPTCLKRFTLSSALLQHVESSKCAGSDISAAIALKLTGGMVTYTTNEHGKKIATATARGWNRSPRT